MLRGSSSAQCRHSDKTSTRLEMEMRNLIHKYFGGYRPQHYSIFGGITKALY